MEAKKESIMQDQITTATVVSPAYRAGQRALREAVSVGCAPNWGLARKLGSEFHAGFRHEWDDISLYSELAFYDERVAKLAADRIAQDY